MATGLTHLKSREIGNLRIARIHGPGRKRPCGLHLTIGLRLAAQATVDQTGRCPALPCPSFNKACAHHRKTSGHPAHLTITYSGHISSPCSTKACAVDNGSAGISMENCTCRKEET